MIILAAVLAAACAGGPSGMMDLSFGDSAEQAAQDYGGCGGWVVWRGSDTFEQCQLGPVELYGLESYVWLYRGANALEGLAIWYPDCTGHESELKSAIWVGELELDPEESYITWGGGAVARFERTDQPDGRYSCTFTVTDDEFGREYSSRQLGSGLR